MVKRERFDGTRDRHAWKRVVVVDAPAVASAAVAPSGTGTTESSELIGETPNRRGYSLSVSSVRMERGGMRIRLALRGEQFAKHLDITSEICRDALPLLELAASLGGGTEERRPWWFVASAREFRERIDALTQDELEMLGSAIRSMSGDAQIDVEVQGDRAAQRVLARLSQKKRILAERIHALNSAGQAANRDREQQALVRPPDDELQALRRRLGKDAYAMTMLKAVGAEIRKRYGGAVADEVFNAAKVVTNSMRDDGGTS